MQEYTIDASNKKLGRVATEVAVLLMGKNTPGFRRHIFVDAKVTVTNVGTLALDEKKIKAKEYKRYSGYPGGLKTLTLEQVIEKKGAAEALRLAIYGMLPSNRLRAKMMKGLIIKE